MPARTLHALDAGPRGPGGRRPSEARQRLVGLIGSATAPEQARDFEGLAAAAGLPCDLVRRTLASLRREGLADVLACVPSPHRRAPRALYGAGPRLRGAADGAVMELGGGHRLAQALCLAWR